MTVVEEKSALVAMSGGVDSSVAVYLLQAQGYRCEGATMRLYHNCDIGRGRRTHAAAAQPYPRTNAAAVPAVDRRAWRESGAQSR